MIKSTDITRNKHPLNKLQKWHKVTSKTMLVVGACFFLLCIFGIVLLAFDDTNNAGYAPNSLEVAFSYTIFFSCLIFGSLGVLFLGIGAISRKCPCIAGIITCGISSLLVFLIMVHLDWFPEVIITLLVFASLFAAIGTINIAVWRVSRNNSNNFVHISE